MAIPPFPDEFDLQVHNAKVDEHLHVMQAANVHGELNVAGAVHLQATVRLDSSLTVAGAGVFAANLTTPAVQLTLPDVDATQWPRLQVGAVGQVALEGSLRVSAGAEIGGALTVTGVTQLGGDAHVAGHLNVNGTVNATAIHQNGTPLRVSPWRDVTAGINYAGGRVGIGTESPGKALDVTGQALFRSAQWGGPIAGVAGTVVGFDPANGGGTGFLFAHAATGQATRLWLDGNPLIFAPLSTERMRITSVGSVGIGTPTPGAKLHVANGGSIINGVTVGTDMAGLIDYPWEYETVGVTALNFNLRLQSPNAVIFHSGDALQQRMIVSEAGNLGIGTLSPETKLHVADGGSITNGILIGTTVRGLIKNPWPYETIGVAQPNFNLRLESPNAIIFHPGGSRNNVLWIDPQGNLLHAKGARCDGLRWIDHSSGLHKTDVDALSLEKALDALVDLRPVIFRYRVEDERIRHVGFIAEDVPELVASQDRKGVSAMDIVGVLTRVVQHQQQQITEIYTQLHRALARNNQVADVQNGLSR